MTHELFTFNLTELIGELEKNIVSYLEFRSDMWSIPIKLDGEKKNVLNQKNEFVAVSMSSCCFG